MITREGMRRRCSSGTPAVQEAGTNIIAGAVGGTISAGIVAGSGRANGHRVNLACVFQVTAPLSRRLRRFIADLRVHELTEANLYPTASPCTGPPRHMADGR